MKNYAIDIHCSEFLRDRGTAFTTDVTKNEVPALETSTFQYFTRGGKFTYPMPINNWSRISELILCGSMCSVRVENCEVTKKRYVKLWDWLAHEADQKEEDKKSPLG